MSVINFLWPFFALFEADYWIAGFGYICAVGGFASVYLLQDEVIGENLASDYTAIIGQVTGLSAQLADIGSFLRQQQSQIADTEAILAKLKDEKKMLEPIILTQRETVEAIMSSHASRLARNVWKERLIGFLLGLLASVIASIIYGLFPL